MSQIKASPFKMDSGLKHPSIAQVEAAAACVGVILLILVVITVVVVVIILVMRYRMKEKSEFVVHVSRNFNNSESSRDKESPYCADYDKPQFFTKSRMNFDSEIQLVDTQENPSIYNHLNVTSSSFIDDSAPDEMEHAFHNPELEIEDTKDCDEVDDGFGGMKRDFEKTANDTTLLPDDQEDQQEAVFSLQQGDEYFGNNGMTSDGVKKPPIILPRTTAQVKSPRRPPPVIPIKPKAYSAKTTEKPPISTKPTKPKPPPLGSKPFAYALGDSSLLKRTGQEGSALHDKQYRGDQVGSDDTKVTVKPELKPKPKIMPRKNV